MRNKIIIVCVACALVFGVGGFYGGMKYQQSQGLSIGNIKGNFSGQPEMGIAGTNFKNGSNAANGGMASGEIIAKDDTSLTVKLKDGGSKIVLFSSSTQLEKMGEAQLNDFVVGKQIIASGTANSDGSVTAKSIQLRQDVQPIPSASK